MADELASDSGLAELGSMIAALSEWIDGSYPPEMIGTELHERRRIDKLMEEAGEVGQALGGRWGENPRKGVTHTAADVDGELLDVAVTALGAWESRNGNHGYSIAALYDKMSGLLKRVGLPQPQPSAVVAEVERLRGVINQVRGQMDAFPRSMYWEDVIRTLEPELSPASQGSRDSISKGADA